jgi:hypothetical protein
MQYRPGLLNSFLARTRLNFTPLCTAAVQPQSTETPAHGNVLPGRTEGAA